MKYNSVGKRLLDLFLSIIFFLGLFPIFIVTLIILFITNNGRPFFFQGRPGKGAKVFKIIKFKTMNDKEDTRGKLLADSDRLTMIGKFVRKTSLDEIPQLLNVIKGDMSLVGPRPLLTEYLSKYNSSQSRRHEVRPGITGWAQVNGRNLASWEKRLEMDVWYVENLSFCLDLKILRLTIWKVLRSEGISGAGAITMDKFEGNS